MQFTSFSEFLAMGNHGLYVWLSYGFTILSLALLIIFSVKNNQQVKQDILKKLQRDEKLKKAQEKHEQSIKDTLLEIE